MASTFQKLLRNQSASRIITILHKPQQQLLPQSVLAHLSETKPLHHCPTNLIPLLGLLRTDESGNFRSLQFYPSYHPFGFFLNPVSSSSGFVESGTDDVVSDDSQTILADSVKKKRKRKMNKHKLGKLRKRLKRKT
ncbi:unnamed protein product [Ilex paraguariensis]|uniref:Small ribosomal subunit protein mS38 n=1 Tax=Ilex paraguariensis TaxID=185542 RepID=A0ABC8UHC8_9AQUA